MSPLHTSLSLLGLSALVLLGCAPVDCPSTGSPLVLQDGSNYALESSLSIESTPLAEYAGEALLDFGSLTTDPQGHALDPVADIDVLSLLAFELSEAEVEAALPTDALSQSDMALFTSLEVGDRTSASLSELTLLGNDIDVEQYFEEGVGAWLLTVNTGTVPGVGARMVAFLEPRADSTATEASITDDSALLDLDVDLLSLEPTLVSEGDTELSVDWSELTANAMGNDLDSGAVDQVMLGRYDDLGAEDLQEDFLDLELLADGMWTVDIDAGSEATLSDIDPLDADSTWVLALRCTTCSNPAPPFLTFLEMCQ